MGIDAFIFTGIPGLRKTQILRHLRKYVLTEYQHEHSLVDLDDEEFEKQAHYIIPIIELSRLSKEELTADLFELYDIYTLRFREFQKNLRKLQGNDYRYMRYVFIHTHLTNCLFGHYRTWLALRTPENVFENLNIKRLINLIDNVHTCRHIITSKEYPYTLDQIITWRDIEQMVTEMLAGRIFPEKSIFDKSKVFAINHCLKTIADLLFSKKMFQLYTAYPISKIRTIEQFAREYKNMSVDEVFVEMKKEKKEIREGDEAILKAVGNEIPDSNLAGIAEELKLQNKEFREFFNNAFISYDPSTIDEIPLVVKGEKSNSDSITIGPEDFWEAVCAPEDRLAGRDIFDELGSIEIPVAEIKALAVTRLSDKDRKGTSIKRQVRSRDLRLIDQADGLIAYRPTLGGPWSDGVYQEVDHVNRHLHRPFFVIKDKRDGPLDQGGTLKWEYGPGYWAEFDLSTSANRRVAFEYAEEKLCESIENSIQAEMV